MHGLARRRSRDVVPGAGVAGARLGDHDDRGAGERRGAAPAAAGLHRLRRRAVRFLHPRDDHGRREAARRARHALARRPSGGDQREHLPLHGLPQDPRRDGRGRARPARRGAAAGGGPRVSLIGRPVARAKVTGAARYPADLVRSEMLHCKAVFAHRPHARIDGIDAAHALALPGVVAVLTAADVPCNRYGLIDADQEVLCSERVRYVGDRVALVIAADPQTAERAAKLVEVAYTDLPFAGDALSAIEPGAPLVHEARGTNVLLHQKIRKGDAERALTECDIVLSATFTTSWQEHAYLQPDAGIAYYEGETLVVETAGQWLHEDLRQIAAVLALEESAVSIRYAKIGGAFGGREDLSVQALLALATWKTKRPTAIVWNREESIVGHHKRHPFHIETTWGAKRDGTVLAVRTRTIADGGAYASTSVEVLKCAAIFAQGPYRIPNVATDAIVAYTNNVPSGAFRGFGSPQAHWAAESMITRIAHALEIDPVDVRRKNLYRDGDTEATGNVLPAGVSALA